MFLHLEEAKIVQKMTFSCHLFLGTQYFRSWDMEVWGSGIDYGFFRNLKGFRAAVMD